MATRVVTVNGIRDGHVGLDLECFDQIYLKSCPHANACMTRPMFITTAEFLPHHRAQRRQFLQIITTAEARSQIRLVEMNQQVLCDLDG